MKNLLWAALLLSCGCFAQPQPGNPNDPMDMVKQARKLNGEGKQDEALALYRKALASSPNLFDAHLGAGIALDLEGKYGEARQEFQQAIDEATPEQKAQAQRSMAISYAFEGKAAEAARYEEPVISVALAKQTYVTAAEVSNELARLYIESGDLDNAYKWYHAGYETALKKPDLKDTDRALWDFRWEHALARIAARRGKHDEAMQHVAAAKAALDKTNNPDQQRFFPYLTGYVAFYNGDYKTAIADLQKVNPPDPFINVLIAQAYEKTGDKAQAMEYYRKVLASNAHNPTGAFSRPLAKKKLG